MEHELNGAAVEASAASSLPSAEDDTQSPAGPFTEALNEGASDDVAMLPPVLAPDRVESWFAQRDDIIKALHARRELLLTELARTVERLSALGVRVEETPIDAGEELEVSSPKHPRAKKVKRKNAARPASTAADKVMAALTKTPTKLSEVITKLKMDPAQVRSALVVLHAEGKVRRSGVGGALYSRAA